MVLELFDILNLPPAVVDLIFQHLTGKEILDATTVHPSYNKFLSEYSDTAFKDIIVYLMVTRDNSNLDNFTGSKRRYQHLKAEGLVDSSQELFFVEFIEKPERKWKSIIINDCIEKGECEFMQALPKTVELLELHISADQSVKIKEKVSSLDFPELKILKIFNTGTPNVMPCVNKYFKSTPKLETLEIENACDSFMKNIIITSPKLKNLSISGRVHDEDFFSDLAGSTLCLEYLELICSKDVDDDDSYFDDTFFLSISETLKVCQTDYCFSLEELTIVFRMKCLKVMKIREFIECDENIADYLEELKLNEVQPASLTYFEAFRIERELLEIIAINAPNLEELYSDIWYADNLSNPNWFPKLKKIQVNFYTKNEPDISAKPEAQRSRLEKLVLIAFEEQRQEL